MCLGFTQNFAGFVVVRAFLGMAEGGLLPGMVCPISPFGMDFADGAQILYLSGIYTRADLALRIGLFYTAASLSGAFGGLLARGLAEIGTRGGLSRWRWIFVIEGLLVSRLCRGAMEANNHRPSWHPWSHSSSFPMTLSPPVFLPKLRGVTPF